MSVSAISAASWFSPSTQNIQGKLQSFQKQFQQLGQDLQAGNLSAAQSDFAALQQDGLQGAPPSRSTTDPFGQDFNQLAQDLKSGNLSAAQQDYAKTQQDLHTPSTHTHHHHRIGGGDSGGASSVGWLVNQLGQGLQSASPAGAQVAYNALQPDGLDNGGLLSAEAQESLAALSVSA